MALGVTQSLPVDERHTHSLEYLQATLAYLMGGRVAVKEVFGQLDTGAGNDLERATNLARRMVTNWGMSDKLGPVTLGKIEEHIFLGKEMAQAKNYSESTAEIIDQETKRLIEDAERKVKHILRDNLDNLHALAKALLEREILDSHEVDVIIGRAPADGTEVPKPVVTPEG
jgi:cell division protease FtsH